MRNSDNFFSFHKTPLSKCSLFIHVIGLRYTVCSVPASADPLNHIGGPAPHYRPGKFTCSTTKNQETITTLREISDLNNDAFVCGLRYSRLKTGAPCGRERIEKYNQLSVLKTLWVRRQSLSVSQPLKKPVLYLPHTFDLGAIRRSSVNPKILLLSTVIGILTTCLVFLISDVFFPHFLMITWQSLLPFSSGVAAICWSAIFSAEHRKKRLLNVNARKTLAIY